MSFLDIVKSFIPLILIFGMLFGVLILVKKYSFSLNGKKSSLMDVKVIFNQMILPKKYLSVVKVQDKVFVLGICENNITLLKELEYDSLNDEELIQKDTKQNFIDTFKQNLGMK